MRAFKQSVPFITGGFNIGDFQYMLPLHIEAQSLKKNPLVICIPCHRVVGVNGLGGFNSGIDMKRYLLDLEQGEKKDCKEN